MPKAEGKCRAKVKEKRPNVSRSKKECVNDPQMITLSAEEGMETRLEVFEKIICCQHLGGIDPFQQFSNNRWVWDWPIWDQQDLNQIS